MHCHGKIGLRSRNLYHRQQAFAAVKTHSSNLSKLPTGLALFKPESTNFYKPPTTLCADKTYRIAGKFGGDFKLDGLAVGVETAKLKIANNIFGCTTR